MDQETQSISMEYQTTQGTGAPLPLPPSPSYPELEDLADMSYSREARGQSYRLFGAGHGGRPSGN